MVAAIAISLLDRVRLEGQRPSDALEFLPRPKKYLSQSLLTFGGTLTKNKPHALRSIGLVDHVSKGA